MSAVYRVLTNATRLFIVSVADGDRDRKYPADLRGPPHVSPASQTQSLLLHIGQAQVGACEFLLVQQAAGVKSRSCPPATFHMGDTPTWPPSSPPDPTPIRPARPTAPPRAPSPPNTTPSPPTPTPLQRTATPPTIMCQSNCLRTGMSAIATSTATAYHHP